MTFLLCCSVLLASAGQRSEAANVTFENKTKWPVSVFVRSTRQTAVRIRPNESRLIAYGFGLGDNQYLVLRDSGVSENRGSLAYVEGHVVYRAAAGEAPRPVNIDITESKFDTPVMTPPVGDMQFQNRTDFPVYLVVPAINRPIGPIQAKQTGSLGGILRPGNNRIIVVARRPNDDPDASRSPILDFAVLSVALSGRLGDGSYARTSVSIDEGSFGGGLPQAPPPSLDGTWRMPDGLVVRFQGEQGYWVEVRHLADFGFKPGDLGYRGFKNSTEQPKVFKGEVLYQKLGGEFHEWKELTITVLGQSTLEAGGARWTRVRP